MALCAVLCPVVFAGLATFSSRSSLESDVEGDRLKSGLKPCLEKAGISDLSIKAKKTSGICVACGTNLPKIGKATILVPPNFERVDKNACFFALKHEIGHIKNNDCFTIPLVAAICAVATVVFGIVVLGSIPSLLITMSIALIATCVFTRYREGKADDFAICESSNDELKGGRRLLIGLQRSWLTLREEVPLMRMFISSTGKDRFDCSHPSIRSRIKKIEDELKRRGVEMNYREEESAINVLSSFIYKLSYD